jgi:hypothetical protein
LIGGFLLSLNKGKEIAIKGAVDNRWRYPIQTETTLTPGLKKSYTLSASALKIKWLLVPSSVER